MATDKRTGGGAGGSAGRQRSVQDSSFRLEISAETRTTAKAIFKRNLRDSDYAGLVGAPPGSSIEVSILSFDGREILSINATHPIYDGVQERVYFRDEKNSLVGANQSFKVKAAAPPGTGTRIFAQQVEVARRLGVKTIYAEAAGGGPKSNTGINQYNGYYTWPRLGYDAPIPFYVTDRTPLPSSLANARTISDLMRTKRGRTWWKEYGEYVDVAFNLRRDSLSSQILDAYMAEKGYST